jgi:hypothetical protein
MRTMTTLSFAGSGDRDARDRNLLFPSLLGACYFRQIFRFRTRFCDFALTHPPLQGFTGDGLDCPPWISKATNDASSQTDEALFVRI